MSAGKAIEQDGIRVYVAMGNRKLAKGIAIFSLPAVKTCPNCKQCARTCYARKAERLYPQVLPCRERNLEATLSPLFVSLMVTLLGSIKGLRYVRIHEAGDYYSQAYADKWSAIAQALPHITFYGYTKSNFKPVARNINIVQSMLPNGSINFGNPEHVDSMKSKREIERMNHNEED